MKKALYTLAVMMMVLGLSGCGDEKKAAAPVKESTSESALDKVKQEVTPVMETVKQEATEAMDAVEKEVAPMVDKAKETLQEAKEVANEQAQSMQESVEKSVEEAKELVATEDNSAKGAQLYAKCAACHGKNAEKKALNASQVIQGWSKEKIADAIRGYKNSTYGGAMKAVMIGQVATLSDEDIEILAEYISNF